MKQDLEYYQSLEKQFTQHRRWFTASAFGFMICMGVAFNAGPTAGWPWLIGGLAALMSILWARIDMQHTIVLIKMYQYNAE